MEAPKEPRRPTLKWDVAMRQVLCCLYRFFCCDKKQVMEIFSFMFRGHLQERGIRGFVPYATLHTQWSWMRNSGDVIWYHVHIDTEFNTDGDWREVIQRIKDAAEVLQLRLQERKEDIDTSRWKSSGSHVAWDTDFHASVALTSQQRSGTTSLWHERQGDFGPYGLRFYEYCGQSNSNCTTETIDFADVATTEPSQALVNDKVPVDESQHRDDNPQNLDPAHPSVDSIPPLLFRWWNIDSQGTNSKLEVVAGLFCIRETFDPEVITATEFEAFFKAHVTKQELASPFISTFSFPLAPFHRALINQKGAKVSIIDTSKVKARIFYAYPLAVRTRTFTFSWKGYAEYLVWGQIPAEAIVSTLDIETVQLIAQLNRDVNRLLQPQLIQAMPRCNQKLRDILATRHKWQSSFKCGLTLRKLLVYLQVPQTHWEKIAPKFAHCWGWKYVGEKREFMEGALSGNPFSQEELSDSESEWVISTLQATPKKGPKGKVPKLDEDDCEPLDYQEFEQNEESRKDSFNQQQEPETSQKSPRKPFFYRGSPSPDLDWVPPEEEEDTEGHSDEDDKGNDISATQSQSMEERSDTTEETFAKLAEDYVALNWEPAMPENTHNSMPSKDHEVNRPFMQGSCVDHDNRDTDMDMVEDVGEEEDEDFQSVLEEEWPSEDDCPELKTFNPIRFRS
ncbi:uncharacterized protein N7511_010299 [Penicillium nucicola]|uniref:uncharacterized protein n=1 Tax=Penicillium nucicola TaxID=1850975 RepID=UPI00254598A8|nr:uncharacterized protein N7511_010299 [Penicillium nucicola]KAJ5748603.1 hypothetical protein N7511_010299 [Penicillium nucicola]